MNYGEGFDPPGANDSFSIYRPTVDPALDEILFGEEATGWALTHEPISWFLVIILNYCDDTRRKEDHRLTNGTYPHYHEQGRRQDKREADETKKKAQETVVIHLLGYE
jgi:hypothetical protein